LRRGSRGDAKELRNAEGEGRGKRGKNFTTEDTEFHGEEEEILPFFPSLRPLLLSASA